eukprot:gene27444-50298_t
MDITKLVNTFVGGQQVRKDQSKKNIEIEKLPAFYEETDNRGGWLSKALVTDELWTIFNAAHGVKMVYSMQEIVAVNDAGVPLRSLSIYKLRDAEGTVLVMMPIGNYAAQANVARWINECLENNSKLKKVITIVKGMEETTAQNFWATTSLGSLRGNTASIEVFKGAQKYSFRGLQGIYDEPLLMLDMVYNPPRKEKPVRWWTLHNATMPIFKGTLESMKEVELDLILTYDKNLYKTTVQALSKIPEEQMDALIKSFTGDKGIWIRQIDLWTAHLIVEPGFELNNKSKMMQMGLFAADDGRTTTLPGVEQPWGRTTMAPGWHTDGDDDMRTDAGSTMSRTTMHRVDEKEITVEHGSAKIKTWIPVDMDGMMVTVMQPGQAKQAKQALQKIEKLEDWRKALWEDAAKGKLKDNWGRVDKKPVAPAPAARAAAPPKQVNIPEKLKNKMLSMVDNQPGVMDALTKKVKTLPQNKIDAYTSFKGDNDKLKENITRDT